jgi:hypothetical protein
MTPSHSSVLASSRPASGEADPSCCQNIIFNFFVFAGLLMGRASGAVLGLEELEGTVE